MTRMKYLYSFVFRSTGSDPLEHLHFDQIASNLFEAQAERHLARVPASTGGGLPR